MPACAQLTAERHQLDLVRIPVQAHLPAHTLRFVATNVAYPRAALTFKRRLSPVGCACISSYHVLSMHDMQSLYRHDCGTSRLAILLTHLQHGQLEGVSVLGANDDQLRARGAGSLNLQPLYKSRPACSAEVG